MRHSMHRVHGPNVTQPDNKIDLDTLLIRQRVSRAGWEKETRKVYRNIIVKDCSKLFWMPKRNRIAARDDHWVQKSQ